MLLVIAYWKGIVSTSDNLDETDGDQELNKSVGTNSTRVTTSTLKVSVV
jgi:hypothetical protein